MQACFPVDHADDFKGRHRRQADLQALKKHDSHGRWGLQLIRRQFGLMDQFAETEHFFNAGGNNGCDVSAGRQFGYGPLRDC